MFRKVLIASVASFGLLSPLALPATASAHETHHGHRHGRVCRVYYQDPCRPGWIFVGSCGNHRAAERLAGPYRARGCAVWIR